MEYFKDIEIYEEVSIPEMSSFEKAKTMQIGYGTKVFRADRRGIWLGAEQPETAPFWVDMQGNMVATSLDLGDYLQIGEALLDIGAGNITGTYIANGAIVTDKLAANAVTATKINVSELSAISAAIGSVTSGTVTGALIRTSSTGARIQLEGANDALRIYDASNVKRAELVEDMLNFYNEDGVASGTIFATDTGTYEYLYFDISTNTDGSFIFNADNTGRFVVAEDSTPRGYYICADNTWYFDADLEPIGTENLGDATNPWGTVYCVTLVESSDIRLKKNIQPLKYGLKELLQLEPIQYTMKSTEKKHSTDTKMVEDLQKRHEKSLKKMTKAKRTEALNRKKKGLERKENRDVERKTANENKVHLGFSAQEVFKIMPELTENAQDGSEYGSAKLNKTQMVAVIVQAIKELSDHVVKLENEIHTLKQ